MQDAERMPRPRRPGKRGKTAGSVPAGALPGAVAVAALAWAMAPSGLQAQPVPANTATAHAGEHLHTPLETSPTLAWPELISTTLTNYPRFVELAARDAEAGALMERGRGWLSSRPTIAARYQTDRPFDNADLREVELGLELPLWRIGERQAAGSLGSAATAESQAAAMALRHEVIGLLRTSLWDIERAANELAVAREAASVAAELLRVLERRYDAGELPLNETLLMQSTKLERDADVIAAEAMLVDAERAYQSLTGLNVKPARFVEPLTEREDFDATHPRLLLANADVERARADLEVAQRAAKGTPKLTIGPKRERAAFSDYSADSLSVMFAIPVGGTAHPTAAASAAARRAAQAEAARLELLRELDLELHEARHTLLVIEESLELARRRAELAARTFEMSRRAFAQGETTLLELLRSEETATLVEHEVAGLEVERQRTIAEINQAVGVWP